MKNPVRNLANFVLSSLLLLQCIPFKESEIDPNSSLNTLLNLLRIQASLQPREIRIIGTALNSSKSNEPFYKLFVSARKMPNGYFTDFSEGPLETMEGNFEGTFLPDANGTVELVLESGLGTYKVDFYEDTDDELILRRSEILHFENYSQPLATSRISQSEGGPLIFNWDNIVISPKNQYSPYTLLGDGDVKFIGESNGRSFFQGRLSFPKSIEFQTIPETNFIRLEFYIFLAYTDNGVEWNSLVLKKFPLSFSGPIKYLGAFLEEDQIVMLIREIDTDDNLNIHRYRISTQNPNNYTLSSNIYNPVTPGFTELQVYDDQNFLYAGGLIYRELATVNAFFISFDFFETPGIPLNMSNVDSPFEPTNIDSNMSSFSQHNGSFVRIYHNGGGAGTLRFMDNSLSNFNGAGFSLNNFDLVNQLFCRFQINFIYCLEQNAGNSQVRFSVRPGAVPFSESTVLIIPNETGTIANTNGSIGFRGSINNGNHSLASYLTTTVSPQLQRNILFRVDNQTFNVDIPGTPPRLGDNNFIVIKEFTLENGMGTNSGQFLQLTRENNFFDGGANPIRHRQPYLTSTRSQDGNGWSQPVKVNVRPSRP